MSALNGQPLHFRYRGQGTLLRLEVSWSGDVDPPWYGDQGLRTSIVDAVLTAAGQIKGVSGARESLSSSSHLRVWVTVQPHGGQRAVTKRALVAAVRGALTPVAA